MLLMCAPASHRARSSDPPCGMSYDEVLKLNFPNRVEVVGYADDLAVIATALMTNAVEVAMTTALRSIQEWMVSNGLGLTSQKTEAVLLSSRWNQDIPEIQIKGHQVAIIGDVKYLRVTLDSTMTYRKHLVEPSARAAKTAMAVTRLMPNMLGSLKVKQAVFMSAAMSRFFYATLIWPEQAGRFKCNVQ